MKKLIVFHPLFFAVYPVMEILYRTGLPFSQSLRALVLFPTVAGLLMYGLYHWDRDWQRAGWITSLCLFVLLYYGGIYQSLWDTQVLGIEIGRHEILFPLWLLLFLILGSRWVWRKLNQPRILTQAMNLMAVIAVLLSSSRYVLRMTRVSQAESVTSPQLIDTATNFEFEGRDRPDIYYIVADGYARADVLETLYDFDNSEFLDYLTSRGFYIAEESQANYIQTGLSVASSLNFDYLTGFSPEMPRSDVLIDSIHHSWTREILESMGYVTVAVQTGYPLTTLSDADVFLDSENDSFLNPLESWLLLLSTAAVVPIDAGWFEIPNVGYAVHRSILQHAFAELPEIPQLPQPKFVFYHVISPHPPFFIDRDGNAVVPKAVFSDLADGSNFYGTADEYIEGYVEKLRYTNTMLMEAIDSILSNSETPPIIILQADHGPGAYLAWDAAEDTCLWERVAILNAFYLPGGGVEQLYPSITPVNTFRVVFDTYFGADYGLLEDRSYYSFWHRPFDFVEVSHPISDFCGFE